MRFEKPDRKSAIQRTLAAFGLVDERLTSQWCQRFTSEVGRFVQEDEIVGVPTHPKFTVFWNQDGKRFEDHVNFANYDFLFDRFCFRDSFGSLRSRTRKIRSRDETWAVHGGQIWSDGSSWMFMMFMMFMAVCCPLPRSCRQFLVSTGRSTASLRTQFRPKPSQWHERRERVHGELKWIWLSLVSWSGSVPDFRTLAEITWNYL